MTPASSPSNGAPLPRDCWYAMALASQVGPAPLAIPFQEGELVATRRADGAIVVRSARCAHRGCSLSGGWIRNGRLTCPYHGWQYDDAGKCVHIPALRPEESIPAQARVRTLPCQERYGLVWVWIAGDHAEPSYPLEAIPELERPGMTHQPAADLSYLFQGHFSRTVENGIDPTHAPFTHGKSIGKVDPSVDLTFPHYEVEKRDYALLAQMPIKVKKLRGVARWLLQGDSQDIYKSYRFIYPNLLMSLVNFGRFTLISLQAHVPTGPQETLMLSTNARNFLRNRPLLTSWFNRITISTGQKIALEDDAIIKGQLPTAVSYSGSNEVLIESDRILIEYRRMMRQHQP